MITLYSTGCPKCCILKKKLEAKGIPYELNENTDELIANGIAEVPILKADGVFMRFPEANEWVNNYTEGKNGN